jgi:hypothetical protein
MQQPMGQMQQPMGQMQQLMGQMQQPMGQMQQPMGRMPPMGQMQQPMGQMQQQNYSKPVNYSVLTTISNLIKTGRLNYSNLSPKLINKIQSLQYPQQMQQRQPIQQRNMSYNSQNYNNQYSNPEEEIKHFQSKKKKLLNDLVKIKEQQIRLLNNQIYKKQSGIY